MIVPEQVERFFRTAQMRYAIKLRRERGEPPPWTESEIFQTYRFCNVFREDDRVTKWIKEHVRDPLSWDPCVVYACVLARFFNLPSTLEVLEQNGLLNSWNPGLMRDVLRDRSPLITGAYMVKTPLRRPKAEGIIEILEPVWQERRQLYNFAQLTNSMERVCARLQEFPWIGPFMSYQVCRDLVYTSALLEPLDYLRWAQAGPGALTGIRYLGYLPWDGDPLSVMQWLAELARQDEYWPRALPPMTIHDVQTWLCEFGKYEKARLGEGRPKQLFKPTD